MVVVVFPSPSGSRGDRRDVDVLAHWVTCDPAQGIEMDLGLGGAVRDDLFFFESEVPRHLVIGLSLAVRAISRSLAIASDGLDMG